MTPPVQMRAVHKAYPHPSGSPFVALAGITLELAPGQLVAVVGRSGSGKSTLLNLIAGIDRPSGGEVCVAGTRLEQLSEKQLTAWRGRHVGVVFQSFQLLPTLTALENVTIAMDFVGVVPRGARRDRAAALLASTGIADQANKLPSTMSGGQQQRVAIARALANDPPVVVADEPTGNLDSRTALQILEVFEAVAGQGKTLVVASHDAEVASRAGRVVRLRDGQVEGGPV